MTLRSHSLCWVWVCAGQRISLSALARNPHKGLSSRSPTRLEVEEERKVREKTERVGKKRRGAEESGGFELAVQKMTELTEVRKATAQT